MGGWERFRQLGGAKPLFCCVRTERTHKHQNQVHLKIERTTGGERVRWPCPWVHKTLKILFLELWEYRSFLPLLHPSFLCAVRFCWREEICHWFIQTSSPAPHTSSLSLTPTTSTTTKKEQTSVHPSHEPDPKASILLESESDNEREREGESRGRVNRFIEKKYRNVAQGEKKRERESW